MAHGPDPDLEDIIRSHRLQCWGWTPTRNDSGERVWEDPENPGTYHSQRQALIIGTLREDKGYNNPRSAHYHGRQPDGG
jgi:hypothetical protein